MEVYLMMKINLTVNNRDRKDRILRVMREE